MRLTIEMDDPQAVILDEIAGGFPQKSVALTYAFIIAQQNTADWPRINAAIRERWKGAGTLERIKTAAWRQVDEWKRKGGGE